MFSARAFDAGFPHLFIPDMRAGSFPDFTVPLFEDIKKVFKNETGRVFIYPSSGMGTREVAMTNVLSLGDRELVSHFGQFTRL